MSDIGGRNATKVDKPGFKPAEITLRAKVKSFNPHISTDITEMVLPGKGIKLRQIL